MEEKSWTKSQKTAIMTVQRLERAEETKKWVYAHFLFLGENPLFMGKKNPENNSNQHCTIRHFFGG